MPACDGGLHLEGVSDLMNMQVRVGPSRIAGQGLFAAQDIKKGSRIMGFPQFWSKKRRSVVCMCATGTCMAHAHPVRSDHGDRFPVVEPRRTSLSGSTEGP